MMRSLVLLLTKVLMGSAVLSVLTQQCAGGAIKQPADQSEQQLQAQPLVQPAVEHIVAPASQYSQSAVAEARSAVYTLDEDEMSLAGDDASEVRQHNKIKIKKKKPKLKKTKKLLKKILPFLLIPLLIQAKLIPLFLLKLKFIALKAFGIGKLALLLILINVIYNTVHGAQTGDQQYSQEALASEHYGYNGGPEYGAWVNRREYDLNKP